MSLKLDWATHTLNFTFDAGTSRGVLREKTTWIIKVSKIGSPELFGLGEAGPLKGLSPEDQEDFPSVFKALREELAITRVPKNEAEALTLASQLVSAAYPSVRFAVETALLDLINGSTRKIFANPFSMGKKPIPINGLIWMGDKDFMQQQIKDKLAEGYKCLKLKIGSLDFSTECEILAGIRKKFGADDLMIRLDANGGFTTSEALIKLEKLTRYKVHSVEQPVQPGQWEAYHVLCNRTPIPIALDEELITIDTTPRKAELLDFIQPQFLVIKPTLLGGFQQSFEWIELAEKRKIGWWITSALESNIGLNAIAQFAAEFSVSKMHGLGTGQLYSNNFTSPLFISHGFLNSGMSNIWDLRQLTF